MICRLSGLVSALALSLPLVALTPPNNAAQMGMQQNMAMQMQMSMQMNMNRVRQAAIEAKRRRALEQTARLEGHHVEEIKQPQGEVGRISMDPGVPFIAEGGILVGTAGKWLRLWNRADRMERWAVRVVGDMEGAPVLADGLVIYTNQNYQVLALDQADGKELYRVQLDALKSFQWAVNNKTRVQYPIVDGGRLYLATYGKGSNGEAFGKLYALNLKTGSKEWEAPLRAGADHPPMILGDRILVAGAPWVQLFQIQDGKLLWNAPLGTATRASMGTEIDGRYYLTADEDAIALDLANGERLWRVKASNGLIGEGKRLFFTEQGHFGSHTLVALDSATGQRVWERKDCGDWMPWVQDGKVFLAGNKEVVCLEATDGRDVWHVPMDKSAPWPILPMGNRLLMATLDGKETLLHAIDPSSGNDAWIVKVTAKPGNSLVTADSEGILFPADDGRVVCLR